MNLLSQLTSNIISVILHNNPPDSVFSINRSFRLGDLGFPRVREMPMKTFVKKLITERTLTEKKPVLINIEGETVKDFVRSYQAFGNQKVYKISKIESNMVFLTLIEKFYLFYFLVKKTPKYTIDSCLLPTETKKDQLDKRLNQIGIINQPLKDSDECNISILCNQLLMVSDQGAAIASNEPFIIEDNFSFMLANKDIEQTFKQIIQLGETLTIALDAVMKALLRHPEFFISPKSLSEINISKWAFNNKQVKKRYLQQNSEKKQPHKSTIVQSKNNKPILKIFKFLEEIYPSQFIAYLYFEILLEHIYSSKKQLSTESISQKVIGHARALTTSMLVESLKLLYPYAQQVTQKFGIDLAKDMQLQDLLERDGISSQITEAINEYDELQDLQKKSKCPLNKNLYTGNDNELPYNFDTSIHLGTKPPKIATNRTNNSHNITIKSSKEKDHKKRNSQIVAEYQALQTKKSNAALEKRMETIKHVYDLPPRTFVTESIIKVLSTTNKQYFDMLFGLIPNDKKMTNNNIQHLTESIHKILAAENFQCADFFKMSVDARRHERHTDGNKLPENWINLRRSTFIIFGIFPENWEPKTKEDNDAMNKYEMRLYEKACIEIYQNNFAKK